MVGHKISDLTENVYTDRDKKWLHDGKKLKLHSYIKKEEK